MDNLLSNMLMTAFSLYHMVGRGGEKEAESERGREGGGERDKREHKHYILMFLPYLLRVGPYPYNFI